MNIEDLIRAANPVRMSDLPDGDSPHARRALAEITRERPADTTAGRPHHPLRARKLSPADAAAGRPHHSLRARQLWLTALAVAAAGAAVAIVVSVVPAGPSPNAQNALRQQQTAGSGPGTSPTASPAPRPAHAPAVQLLTARQVLLQAAKHVAPVPASGTYWRVHLISGLTFPGGTEADPYDIAVTTSADQWNPSSAGQKEWVISQQLGARPASPADAAAWRAAGSPATWHSGLPARQKAGWLGGFPLDWMDTLAASTAASARTATWQDSDGTVGYVEGDLAGLNTARFAAMPTSTAGIAKVLRDYYKQLFCAKNPGQLCSTEDQIIWAEAVMLLQDPVSARVRAATFRVMAALPGVQSLGLMTDPLGRTGYALAPGGQDPNAVPSNYNPKRFIIVDPRTGSVLATEELGPMPRTLHCLSYVGRHMQCAGSVYYGRSYPDQVDSYVAVVSEGWTNAAPDLPPSSAWTGPTGFPGLPPLP